MKLSTLKHLVEAEYDKQRADKQKHLMELSPINFSRFCKANAFVAQALVEKRTKAKMSGSQIDWYYNLHYKIGA